VKYVLGGGIAGLLWAYYHPDYVLVTDKLGWSVVGVHPLVLLHDTPLTRQLVCDVEMAVDSDAIATHNKRILYLTEDGSTAEPTAEHLDAILLKKMIPWTSIRDVRLVGATLTIHSRAHISRPHEPVIDVDIHGLIGRLVKAVTRRDQIVLHKVTKVWANAFATENGTYGFDHLVTTLPAPTFARLWQGPPTWTPVLNCVPVTLVMSQAVPDGARKADIVYDARPQSPVSRTAQLGTQVQYEITGHISMRDQDVVPLVPSGQFPYPFGRIIQDTSISSPVPTIVFLGRFAEWDYRLLVDDILARVHGHR
jgi:hypothetical protein